MKLLPPRLSSTLPQAMRIRQNYWVPPNPHPEVRALASLEGRLQVPHRGPFEA